MMYDSIVEYYMNSLRKICNIINFDFTFHMTDTNVSISMQNKKVTLPFTDDIEYKLRCLLYEVMSTNYRTADILKEPEFKLSILPIIVNNIDRYYKTVIIDELLTKCHNIRTRGTNTLVITLMNGLIFKCYNMKDGYADISHIKNIIKYKVRYEDIYDTIIDHCNKDGLMVEDLVDRFIRKLSVIDWIESELNHNTHIYHLSGEEFGDITLARLNKIYFIISSDRMMPRLVTAINAEETFNQILDKEYKEAVTTETIILSLMDILFYIIGGSAIKNFQNGIYSINIPKTNESYTLVGNVLTTPYATYQLEDDGRSLYQVIKHVLILKERGALPE